MPQSHIKHNIVVDTSMPIPHPGHLPLFTFELVSPKS